MKSHLVIFVRHAESESNRILHTGGTYVEIPDPELTELGHRQAKTTAEYLIHCFDRLRENTRMTVWTSPFLRTQQTAEPFIKLAGDRVTEIQCIPNLQEYTSPNNPLTPELRANGCVNHETWSDFIQHIRKFNELLHERCQTECLVIFGHSLVISTLLSYYVSQESIMPDSIEELSFQIPNCAITCLRLYKLNTWNLYTWNLYTAVSIAHLPNNLVSGTHVPFGRQGYV